MLLEFTFYCLTSLITCYWGCMYIFATCIKTYMYVCMYIIITFKIYDGIVNTLVREL